jgi:hypothetical protein
MEKIRIAGHDWDLSDWPTEEITIEGIVTAMEGCGDNEDQAAVIDVYGREMRIVGVRRQGSRVEIVVDTRGAGQ